MTGRDATPPDRRFRPWSDNPFRTRADVERALRALVAPVEAYRSPGGARIRLDAAAAQYDEASAEMEGFCRLLWGLAPAQAGGADWIDWAPIVRGLANGCDPAHPEYWGDTFDRSQRLVELAAVGFALRLVPDVLWEPLTAEERRTVAAYLRTAHARAFADNNWKFFRLLIGLGLRHVGEPADRAPEEAYVAELDAFHLGEGWYQDGDVRRADHYVPFAFHFYGLLLAALDGGEWTRRYRDRADAFAPDLCRWFAADGAALCFGRSMTYRFAIGGVFGALAVAGSTALPWGRLKGHYLRHLRWWAGLPFAARDGILPVGYGYPNLLMSEPYNSAQSPYWALKVFLPLMLPGTHPFWASDEEDWIPPARPAVQRHAGLVVSHPFGDAVALSSGQQTGPRTTFVRAGAEKYAKFAYSARYGFSVESDPCRFGNAVLDGMIGFSDDGVHMRVREGNEDARVAEDVLYARWRPWPDIAVDTWLYWDGPFHVRVHRIEMPRPLSATEGGFAIPRAARSVLDAGRGRAVAATDRDLSAILDLGPSRREGRCHLAPPNTNLVAARTVVPQLRGTLPAGITVLGTAVLAADDPAAAAARLRQVPVLRPVSALERLVTDRGVPVTLMRSPPG